MRITVKIGTSTLTYENGRLNLKQIEGIARVLSDLINSGHEIVLVTSGAIGVGAGKIKLCEKTNSTREKQALAAIGQCELMSIYDKFFGGYSHTVAQVLLTRDVFDDEKRRQNASNTFEKLLEYGVVPVVNENDTVSVEQIEFGDNDTLSAMVAALVGAELLIILSDIDGLFDRDPNKYPDATLIRRVDDITEEIKAKAGGVTSKRGTGGMLTKVMAAQIATGAGCEVVIANGRDPKIIYDILDGEYVGTYFSSH